MTKPAEGGRCGPIASLGQRLPDFLLVAVFAALPVVGLWSGPSYAGLIFGLGGVRLVLLASRDRSLLHLDHLLIALAAAFSALCWASVSWSIVPRQSVSGALQLTALMIGTLVFLAGNRSVSGRARRLLTKFMLLTWLAGTALLASDYVSAFRFTGRDADPFKYNRGIIYLSLLAWPLLGAYVRNRDWRSASVLATATVAILAMGNATTGKLAAVAGTVTLLAAFAAPQVVERTLVGLAATLACLLPLALRLLGMVRPQLVPYVKSSAIHRFEIWDYMSARLLERPFLGWGLWSSEFVPIRPEELRHYIWADRVGIYPHNQWLQLWLEIGPAGVLLGLALVVVALSRIRRLDAAARPFAYAAVMAALVVSVVDYQVTTDSWWAALAAIGFLFSALKPTNPDQEDKGGPQHPSAGWAPGG